MSTVKSIKTGGDYTTIAGWEADLSLFAGDDCIGELYDEVYTPAAYITINDTSPASITLRAHSSARHDGTPGSGARVDGGSFGYAGVFTITTTVPTNIEWVDVYNFGYRSSAFVTQSTGAVVIASCIARDPLSTRSPYAGPYAINLSGEVHVVNCGVWGVFDDLGIMLQKWGTAGTRTAWNCTVYGCDYGISSGSSGGYTREAVNCISVGHTGATGNDWGGTFSKTYCMDSDGTLPASTGNVSSVTVADQFVSTVAGSEDLHLKLGSDAIGAGSDLGTTAGVNFDVDGRDRDAEGDTWDMGWDQWYVAGKVAVGATWNNAASWSPSGVPTASDDVVFVAGSPSMAIDTAAVCASLTSTGYTNTLTQNAGQTLTVSGDIAWAAGTFTGGDSAISAETFTLTGGAWTSTSDTFSVGRAGTGTQTPWASSGGVFTHNSGTVLWDEYIPGYGSLTSYVTITAAISFYDLRVRGGLPYNYVHYYNLGGSTATITVDNDLEFFSSSSYGFFVLGHEIQLNGNVSSSDVLGMSTVVDIVGNTAQTYTCSGGGVAVRLPVGTTSTFSSTTTDAGLSGITVEAGTFVAPTGTLSIGYNLSQDSAVSVNTLVVTGGTFTHNSGSIVLEASCTGYTARTGVITATTPLTLNDVTFSGGADKGPSAAYGLYYDFSGSSAAITVEGDLVLTKSQSWAPYYNGHEIQLDGNLTCTDSRGGSTVVDIVGNTAQTYTWTSGVIAVHLPAGTTSTFSSTTTDARFAGITVEAGTFVAPTGILSIGDLLSQASTNALVVTGGTFTHNSGSIVLDSYHTSYAFRVALVTATTPLTLNDVTFSGGYGQNHPAYAQAYDFSGSSAAITVEGDLVLTKTQSYAPWLNGGTLTLQGNLTCTNCSGGTTAITLNGTGDQTITHTAGTMPGGAWTNSNTGGKVRQATDVPLGDDLTIASSATWCMHGFGLTIGGDLVITGSLIKHLAGDASPTVTGSTTGSVTTGSCYPYHTAVGSSPMDWSVAANWFPASVPTSSDDVVLDNAIDVNIDTAAVCASLTSTGYSGTLTQEAGQTLTVSGDIAWAAGTFAGGDSAIDALSFSLTAGTWTSTSGTFTIGETVAANRTSFVYSGGTFTHNSGTVLWDSQNTWTGQVTTVTITTAIAFNNLTVSGGTFNPSYPQTYALATSSAEIGVAGTLTFDKIQAYATKCTDHEISAKGNVVINDYNGAGTTLIDIVGNTIQTYSWTGGHIEVRLPTGTTSTFTPGTADAQFVGVTVQDGTFVAPTGTMTLFASTSTRNAMLSMGGTFTHNSGTVVFAYVNYWAGAQATVTVTSPISFNNVTFTGGSTLSSHHNVYQLGASSATITVEGDLLLDSTQTYASFIEGYELTVLGDVTCTACRGGSTAITLNGTGDQTITETAGDWPGGTWTNSNTAGHVIQATDVALGGDLETDSGTTWCQESYALTVAGTTTNNGTIKRASSGVTTPTIGSGNPVEIGPCAAPAEDETALLKRDQLRSLAHHSSSKRLIGRTGNILLRRRHRRILG